LFLLALAAHLFAAPTSGDAALAARGFLNGFNYLVLLAITAYNAAWLGDLRAQDLVNAFLVGAIVSVLLENLGIAASVVPEGAGEVVVSIGRNVGYMAAIGFTLAFTRLILPANEDGRAYRGLYMALALAFAILTGVAFVRTAWLAALITVIMVARLVRKQRYWLIVPLALVLAMMIPVARERVLPGAGEGIESAFSDSQRITTGRWGLWSILWSEEMAPAMPWGNGYGHTFSLSPERLFGFETFQGPQSTSPFVYPHNDFIFWGIELGILGIAALVIFWVRLLQALRWMSRAGPLHSDVANAYALVGIIVTMFLVQIVDNSFAVRIVGESSFLAAGFIFGLKARIGGKGNRRPLVESGKEAYASTHTHRASIT
jgi:hypothetical protein